MSGVPPDEQPWFASGLAGLDGQLPGSDESLTVLLDQANDHYAGARAWSFFGGTATYRDLRREVGLAAAALSRLGVRPGVPVALVLPNCPQLLTAAWAGWRLGAVVVPLDVALDRAQLTERIVSSGAQVVVCLDRAYDVVDEVRRSGRGAVREVVVTALADYLPAVERLRLRLPLPVPRPGRAHVVAAAAARAARSWRDLLCAAAPRRRWPTVLPSDPAVLVWPTPTGSPVTLSHSDLVAAARWCRGWLPTVRPGTEVLLSALPVGGGYGLVAGLLAVPTVGANLVLVPRFQPDQVLDAIEEHRVTLFPARPSQLRELVDHPDVANRRLDSIRMTFCPAGGLSDRVARRWEELTGGCVHTGFGNGCAPPAPTSERAVPPTQRAHWAG